MTGRLSYVPTPTPAAFSSGVHVVTEPITAYLAYELSWEYGPHSAAGEDIRIMADFVAAVAEWISIGH